MIKEIREFYGIPQNVLADYLGVTRSQLSMAEIGKRTLSTSQILILLRFYKAISSKGTNKRTKEIAEIIRLQKSKVEQLVTEKIQQNDYELMLAQRSLDKLKADNGRALQILEILKTLKTGTGQKEKSLIDKIGEDAEKLYKKTGENFQLKLELHINTLKASTDFLRKKAKIK